MTDIKRTLSHVVVLISFLFNVFGPISPIQAQEYKLPPAGIMIHLSPPLNPPTLKGIKIYHDNPFLFDFVLDPGDNTLGSTGASQSQQEQLKVEAAKLIKYFLASLTIPEKDLWVNLSPYEKDRIVPNAFGLTEMGRDLLAQDYVLKQLTASLIYPEDQIGKKFWKRIYAQAAAKYGTTNIPVNTFNKVWVVPEKADVYENAKSGTAYVLESKLKVMLEQDYLSLGKHTEIQQKNELNALCSQMVREVVIPELTKEVNGNKNFARLRQVYNSLILATWYKKKIKDSILDRVYVDKSKVAGVNIDDSKEIEKIYEQYLKAFKKGVYNYIKEEINPITQEATSKKYFSGGFELQLTNSPKEMRPVLNITSNAAMISQAISEPDNLLILEASLQISMPSAKKENEAMISREDDATRDITTILKQGFWGQGVGAYGGAVAGDIEVTTELKEKVMLSIILDQKVKRSKTPSSLNALFSQVLSFMVAFYMLAGDKFGILESMKQPHSPPVMLGVGVAAAVLGLTVFNYKFFGPFGVDLVSPERYGPFWVIFNKSFSSDFLKRLPTYWFGVSGKDHLAYLVPDESRDNLVKGIKEALESGKIDSSRAQSGLRRLITFTQFRNAQGNIENIVENRKNWSMEELVLGNDKAMRAAILAPAVFTRGGVDLTLVNKVLRQAQNTKEGVIKFHIDPALMAQLQNAAGFIPLIINIQPLKSLPGFLGLNPF